MSWFDMRKALLDFIADFANWDASTVPAFLETARALTQAAQEALGGLPGTRPWWWTSSPAAVPSPRRPCGWAPTPSPATLNPVPALLKDNIRCVVLNACLSEAQVNAIAEHIDVVVGMSDVITDKAAVTFAAEFFQALAFGCGMQNAFARACNAIDLKRLPQQLSPGWWRSRVIPARSTWFLPSGSANQPSTLPPTALPPTRKSFYLARPPRDPPL